MRFILTLFAALIMTTSAAHADHDPNVIDVKVNGMVCDFCAQSILKVFNKHPEVDHIDVSFDDQLITVSLKDNMNLSDDDITKDIHYSGYDLVSIRRHAAEM